jgi:ferredoxin
VRFVLNKELNFEIAYFSGTGGTAMVANCFYESLNEAGYSGDIHAISQGAGQHDLLFLLFPIHACNAPKSVYRWIKDLPTVDNIPAAVISVSGGGMVSPNTASNVSSIKKLKKKGYDVIYDQMLIMPNNYMVPTKEPLSVKLLEILPSKVQQIVKDILSETQQRTSPLLRDRFVSKFGELEKPGARIFGKLIKASKDCEGCGWCSKHCPTGNISMVNENPKFAGKCNLCLCCIYGCHKKALMPRIGKFMVLKEGFDLKQIEKKVPLEETIHIDELAKGYLWSGLKKYLQD